MVEFLILLAGLAILCVGTEISVRAAVVIAAAFKLSPLVIGLTFVAFGTDLPELIVAIRGALKNLAGVDTSGLIVGNAVGSSICQISLVAGFVALCIPAREFRRPVAYLGLRLLGSAALLLLLSLDGNVNRAEGAVLVAAFLVYLIAVFVRHEEEDLEPCDGRASVRRTVWPALLLLIVGLGLVVASAELVIRNALAIADMWKVQQSFVGAVIVAVGTSLPELAISVGAALRRQPGLAVGNIVGSNVFDCLIPVGVASLISGIHVERLILVFDLPYLLVVSVVFIVFIRRGGNLSRSEGSVLTALFAGYVVAKFAMR